MSKIAFEPQNQIQFDTYNERGGVILGPYSSHIYRSDPRHLSFLLARYKFISKMLQGKKKVKSFFGGQEWIQDKKKEGQGNE